MQYNVLDSSENVIGHVEADNPVDAWAKAREIYEATGSMVFDVRPVVTRTGEELRREISRRRYIEAKERREYYDSLSDRELLELINSRLSEYVPYPSDIPPREGEGKSIGRMCLEGVANWLEAWRKGIIGE